MDFFLKKQTCRIFFISCVAPRTAFFYCSVYNRALIFEEMGRDKCFMRRKRRFVHVGDLRCVMGSAVLGCLPGVEGAAGTLAPQRRKQILARDLPLNVLQDTLVWAAAEADERCSGEVDAAVSSVLFPDRASVSIYCSRVERGGNC